MFRQRKKHMQGSGESKESFCMNNCTGERKTPAFLKTTTAGFHTTQILGNQKGNYAPLLRIGGQVSTEMLALVFHDRPSGSTDLPCLELFVDFKCVKRNLYTGFDMGHMCNFCKKG